MQKIVSLTDAHYANAERTCIDCMITVEVSPARPAVPEKPAVEIIPAVPANPGRLPMIDSKGNIIDPGAPPQIARDAVMTPAVPAQAAVDAVHAGPFPFTVMDDPAAVGDLWDRIMAGEFGPVADYVAPPVPVPASVSETQFIRAAVRSGLVTAAEGKAYLGTGSLPAFVQGAIDTLPEAERDDAELLAVGAATFERASPLFALLVGSGAATEAQVDDLFRLAATL